MLSDYYGKVSIEKKVKKRKKHELTNVLVKETSQKWLTVVI